MELTKFHERSPANGLLIQIYTENDENEPLRCSCHHSLFLISEGYLICIGGCKETLKIPKEELWSMSWKVVEISTPEG